LMPTPRPRILAYGKLIKEYRARRGISQQAIATALGWLSDKTIRRIERTGHVPPITHQKILHQFLEIPSERISTILNEENYFNQDLKNRYSSLEFKTFRIYGAGTQTLGKVFRICGNYTKPLTVFSEYLDEKFVYPDASLSESGALYKELIEDSKRKAFENGGKFYNGPCARLIKFDQSLSDQLEDGEEPTVITLHLGPVGWFDYTVLNTYLDYEIKGRVSIRQRFAPSAPVLDNPYDVSWCRLSNILTVLVVPITEDGYGVLQLRSPVVSEARNRYISGISENMHRHWDEAAKWDLGHRINRILNRQERAQRGEIQPAVRSNSFTPSGVLSPLLTAQRGFYEEISEGLAQKIPLSAYTFLNLGWTFEYFHPVLIGIVVTGVTKDEFQHYANISPGSDQDEAKHFEFFKLDGDEKRTAALLANQDGWVASGLAAFMTAINYAKAHGLS
jgi:transcriptional regulator with XRE-family HTH domain